MLLRKRTLNLFFLCSVVGWHLSATADTFQENNSQAVKELNQMRAQYQLPPVIADRRLAERCANWSEEMNATGSLEHDSRVYGTEERENIAGAVGYPMTVGESMELWQNSPPHAASMFDEGFPTAVRAGYAQVGGFSCLRICPHYPQQPASGPCS